MAVALNSSALANELLTEGNGLRFQDQFLSFISDKKSQTQFTATLSLPEHTTEYELYEYTRDFRTELREPCYWHKPKFYFNFGTEMDLNKAISTPILMGSHLSTWTVLKSHSTNINKGLKPRLTVFNSKKGPTTNSAIKSKKNLIKNISFE